MSYITFDKDEKLLASWGEISYNLQSKTPSGCGAVDSAPGLGPGGRRFESFHPDQIKKIPSGIFLICPS